MQDVSGEPPFFAYAAFTIDSIDDGGVLGEKTDTDGGQLGGLGSWARVEGKPAKRNKLNDTFIARVVFRFSCKGGRERRWEEKVSRVFKKREAD